MMQAGKDYGVEVIRPFNQFQVGFIMFPPAMYRDALLKGRWVKPVEPQADVVPVRAGMFAADRLKQRVARGR